LSASSGVFLTVEGILASTGKPVRIELEQETIQAIGDAERSAETATRVPTVTTSCRRNKVELTRKGVR